MKKTLRKPYRKMTLASLVSQFYIELGPAQPQLVLVPLLATLNIFDLCDFPRKWVGGGKQKIILINFLAISGNVEQP